MARKCVRFKKTASGRRCAKFSGKATKSKKKGAKARKGRCEKWSKGRTRCLRRAK